MLAQWWADLTPIMKILWGVTLSASLIFVIQSILTFIGADTGDFDGSFESAADTSLGIDDPSVADLGHSGMNLYTFRNLINFLLGFGWSAILLKGSITSVPVLLIVSVVIGVALVIAVMYLFKWLAGMQQSGNINVSKSAVGCSGKVYIPIPASRSGEGKVQISINNSVREYTAITDGEYLKTGTPIKVIEVIDSNTLLVDEINTFII